MRFVWRWGTFLAQTSPKRAESWRLSGTNERRAFSPCRATDIHYYLGGFACAFVVDAQSLPADLAHQRALAGPSSHHGCHEGGCSAEELSLASSRCSGPVCACPDAWALLRSHDAARHAFCHVGLHRWSGTARVPEKVTAWPREAAHRARCSVIHGTLLGQRVARANCRAGMSRVSKCRACVTWAAHRGPPDGELACHAPCRSSRPGRVRMRRSPARIPSPAARHRAGSRSGSLGRTIGSTARTVSMGSWAPALGDGACRKVRAADRPLPPWFAAKPYEITAKSPADNFSYGLPTYGAGSPKNTNRWGAPGC